MSVLQIVHIVDDDESIRCALTRLLHAKGYETRSYKSAGEFLSSGLASSPGCMILDVCMPGHTGLELHRVLANDNPCPAIFLSGRADISMSVEAMRAGAVDFLTKPVNQEHLVRAVNMALARDAAQRASQEHRQSLCQRYGVLSQRERQVLQRVADGKLNKQIASELSIAERTVKAHRAHLMKKMDLHTVAALVRAADELQSSDDKRETARRTVTLV
jgi:FixJ family two-component response regulator